MVRVGGEFEADSPPQADLLHYTEEQSLGELEQGARLYPSGRVGVDSRTDLAHGVLVKLKEVPFHVRLFKLVAPDGDIDWVITNDLDETVTAQVAEDIK